MAAFTVKSTLPREVEKQMMAPNGNMGPAIDERMARMTLEHSTANLIEVTEKVIKRSTRSHVRDFKE